MSMPRVDSTAAAFFVVLMFVMGVGCRKESADSATPTQTASAGTSQDKSVEGQARNVQQAAVEALRSDFEEAPDPYKAIALADLYQKQQQTNHAERIIRRALGLPGVPVPVVQELTARLVKVTSSQAQLAPQSTTPDERPGLGVSVAEDLLPEGGVAARPDAAPAFPPGFLEKARAGFRSNPSAGNARLFLDVLRAQGHTNEFNQVATSLRSATFDTADDYIAVSRSLASAAFFEAASNLASRAIMVAPGNPQALFTAAEVVFLEGIAKSRTSPSPEKVVKVGSLSPDRMATVDNLLLRCFEATMAANASSVAFDLVGLIKGRENAMLNALMDDPKFRERAETVWFVRSSLREEERDAEYATFLEAVEKLRHVAMPQTDFNREVLEQVARATGEQYRPTQEPAIGEAARLLNEAFTSNRETLDKKPSTECLLISALLDPQICALKHEPKIEQVLVSHLSKTRVPDAFCQDFNGPSPSFIPAFPVSRAAHVLQFGTRWYPSTRVTKSPLGIFAVLGERTLYSEARVAVQPEGPAATVPFEVSRFGPDDVASFLSTVGEEGFRIIKGEFDSREFSGNFETAIRNYLSGGQSELSLKLPDSLSGEQRAAHELAHHIISHLLSRVEKRNGSFFLIEEAGYGQFVLMEFKTPLQLRVSGSPTREVQRLNGLEWRGGAEVILDGQARFLVDGRWTEWRNKSSRVEDYLLAATRVNNDSVAWTVSWSGKVRFYRPTQRQIRRALSE